MAGLPKAGVQLVAEGVGSFLGDIGSAQRAVLGFGDAAGKAGGGLGMFGQIATGAMREIGAMAAQAFGAAARATAGFVTDAIGVAGDFEQTLAVLGATSGATAGELQAVAAKAKELGADLTLPTTSATDAASVMLELSKAGMSVQESMDAARGALLLATAAEVDGATAANIISGALNAFGLEATDATRIADLLAGGANASSASMTDLSQGLQQAGFAFDAAGMPVEDLVTALAALTNVGLTGSDSGTALKNAMMRLMNPTKKAAELMASLGFNAYDATGKMKPMETLITDLNTVLGGMNDEQRNAALGTIFLSDGMKAMIPLLDLGADGFVKLKGSVTEAGSAQAVAEAQTRGWNGATAAISSQLETLQLTIGQKLLPLLTPFAFKLAEVIGIVGKFAEGGLSFDALTSLGMFLSDINPRLGSFVSNLAIATDPIKTLKEGLLSFVNEVAAQLPGQLTALGSQIAAGAMVWKEKLTSWVQEAGPGVLANLGTLVSDILGKILEAAPGIISTLTTWRGAFLQWVLDAIPGMGANLASYVQGLLTQIGAALPGIVAALGTYAAEFVAWITKALPLAIRELGSYVASMLGFLVENLPAIVSQLAEWGAQFVGFVVEAVPPMLVALGELVADFLAFIIDKAPEVLEKLGEWGKMFAAWAPGALTHLGEALGKLWSKLTGWISEKVTALQSDGSIGKALIDGIKAGIAMALGGLITAAANAVRAAVTAARNAGIINSPSELMADKVGKPLGDGVALGLQRAIPDIMGAAAMAARAPALPNWQAMAGGGNNYYGPVGPQYSMPVYTNNSPAALQQSMAVIEALS